MQSLCLMFRQQIKYVKDIKRSALALYQRVNLMSTDSENLQTDATSLTPGEKLVKSKLQEAFPEATEIQVADVSGGCGAMYQIAIESPKFKGVPKVQQHRMVNQALAEEIKNMHGLQLTTKVPDSSKE
ncbi:BolA-like protein 3 [Bulinus truncatus]|nr:BolA-like protein 3 [Bulinus truncatus]